MFEYTNTGNNSVVSWARGKNTVPGYNITQDLFYFENQVKLGGPLVVEGEFNGVFGNEAYTRENERVTFSGLILLYNNSNAGIYPPNSSFFMTLADYDNSEYWKDVNVSGRNMSISLNMPLQAIKKTFTVVLEEMDLDLFLGELPSISLIVDNSPPPAPQSLVIRADSYKDKNQALDNDDVVYVTWSQVNDLGSGAERYRISTSYSFNDPETSFTDWETTKMTWNGTEEGDFKLFVWAEDAVGHYGAPAFAQIFIDKKEIKYYYEEFSVAGLNVDEIKDNWIKTLTPTCKVWVTDIEGSGVDDDSVEYSVSTGGLENFEEWKLVDLAETKESILWDDPYVVTTINPRFVEGTENYIRYRAKDLAGNGYTESQYFRLKIDVTQVSYEEVFPTLDVWHDQVFINQKEVSTILVDETSGIDPAQIYYRVSTSKDENGVR
ncbi:MAG: hypothetical protein KAH57_03440, partial [Thermoplasmata archaeon]|nr:hypothetical protein [Thermoplasmata archaeon]